MALSSSGEAVEQELLWNAVWVLILDFASCCVASDFLEVCISTSEAPWEDLALNFALLVRVWRLNCKMKF